MCEGKVMWELLVLTGVARLWRTAATALNIALIDTMRSNAHNVANAELIESTKISQYAVNFVRFVEVAACGSSLGTL